MAEVCTLVSNQHTVREMYHRRSDQLEAPLTIPPPPSTPRVYRTGRPNDPLLCGACLHYAVLRERAIGHSTYHCGNCDRERVVSTEFEGSPMTQAMLMDRPVVRGR